MKGRFQKGNVPWNKDLKGIHLSPETEFKQGVLIGNKHPSWKGGEQKNTKDCNYISVGPNKRIRKSKKVYEEKFGTVPNNWIIYHLDGDKRNDCVNNLIAIPRAILLSINNGRLENNYYSIKEALAKYFKNKK